MFFKNDLRCVIKHTTLSTHADDTQIFYAGDNVLEVEETINEDLSRIDWWYEGNEMRRNHDKYKAIVLGTTTEVPTFMCENTIDR